MNKYQKALWNITQKLNEYSPTDNYGQDLILLQELVVKTIPKKPKKVKNTILKFDYTDSEKFQHDFDDDYICPNCVSTLGDIKELKFNDFQDNYNQNIEYCSCCGQALDWSEEFEYYIKEMG